MRLIPVLDFGGVETTFEIQAAHIDRQRFDFRVCTFWKDGVAAQRIRELGVPVDVLGVDPAVRNPRATLALARYLRRVRPHVLHASIGEANFHAALTGRLVGVDATLIEEQGVPSRRPLSRAVHAGLYRLTDHIVAVSQASADYMMHEEFAPAHKLHVLHNAAGAQFFEPVLKRDPSPRPLRIVTVGRLVEVKNQALLIRAFGQIARSVDAELRIVGDGPLRSELSRLIQSLGLEDRVKLPGFDPNVRGVLDDADVFVLPSHSEGFGIALVEAMARGLLVIGSNGGALPGLMKDLASRWVVDATDETGWARVMRAAVELSAGEREELGSRARALAEEYSPQRHIAALENLYEEVLAGHAMHTAGASRHANDSGHGRSGQHRQRVGSGPASRP